MAFNFQPQTPRFQRKKTNPQIQVYAQENKLKHSLIKKLQTNNKSSFTLRQYLRLNQMFSKTKGYKTQLNDKTQKLSRKAAILMMKRQNEKQFQLAINKLKKCHNQINKRLELNQSDTDLHFLCNIQKIIRQNILKNVEEIEQQLSLKMNTNFSQVEQQKKLKNVQSAIQLGLKNMDIED